MRRRTLLAGTLLAVSAPARAAPARAAPPISLAALERRHGGRLGVAILDTATAEVTAHRGDERFALCSTAKFLAAAFVLARVDAGAERLDRRIVYPLSALVPYSPVTADHAGGDGLTIGALCEAAVTLSDNTAGNLLLESFGGPGALTAYLRTLGDTVTRLDRREPALNENLPGDPRDTTSPRAMLHVLRETLLETALSAPSRAQLAAWLAGSRTGVRKLRAGVPPGWRVGDKTGAGGRNATNDIAILWPPAPRAPILVAAYYSEATTSPEQRDAVLAEVGRLAAGL